jgi:NIMA (never in mitosis gene a)-related kinase
VYAVGLVLHCLGLMRQVPLADAEMYRMMRFADRVEASKELMVRIQNCLMWDKLERPSPQDLPMVVCEGYEMWRGARQSQGQSLPHWAFGIE